MPQKQLPALADKLYRYVLNSQTTEHPNPRYVGMWPTKLKLRWDVGFSMAETNLFLPLQIMHSLSELRRDWILDGYPLMADRFNAQLGLYLQDRFDSAWPSDMVNYWPLQEFSDGTKVNCFTTTSFLQRFTRRVDLPSDTDTSSRVFVWLSREHPEVDSCGFRTDYLYNLVKYVDRGRTFSYPGEDKWKQLNSGAFLTWALPVLTEAKPNNVDSVVNINILDSLFQPQVSEAAFNDLAVPVAAATDLIEQVIRSGELEKSSLYYERPSQFLMTFARAVEDNRTACLCPLLPAARILVRRELRRSVKSRSASKNAMTRAELLIAAVKMEMNDGEARQLIEQARQSLTSSIRVRHNQPPIKTQSATVGNQYAWHCPAYSALLALEALLLTSEV